MKTVAQKNVSRRKRTVLLGAVAFALLAGNVQAQQAGDEPTMVKLIRSLIDSGALKPEAGELLLREAMRDGSVAAAPASSLQAQPGDVRVPYVSETVRDQIRDEIRTQVLAQARDERWAAPDAVPEWTQRITIGGDVRVRNETRLFSDRNDNTQVDWRAINAGGGYDVSELNTTSPPLRNTRENRANSWRIRARLGVTADLGEHMQGGVRLATGNDDGPVSTTQTLGGGLAKKDAWIDQAWLAWTPADWLRVTGGRFSNPYWSTETVFSNDLNFDGLSVQYDDRYLGDRLSLFGTLGLTPLEYSSDSFPSDGLEKMESRDKWLNGMQIGAEWRFDDDHSLRGAVAFYDFRRIGGRLSEPCALYAGAQQCSTDWTRPAFMQKGNTLMLLRDIALDPQDPASTRLPQYVGLASDFELLDVNLRYQRPAFAGYGVAVEGNWVRNMAYDPQDMWSNAGGGIVNNLSWPSGVAPTADNIVSGDTAWQVQATFGNLKLATPGHWHAWLGYRRVDPDAVPDAFNDTDFHLGGTNAKGYYVGASWLFDKRAWLTGSWFSSKEVFGAPQSIDVFQLEVNAKF